jgi:phosphohistidine swiveling domain-containing protein
MNHFKISGEFITDFARTRFKEGAWDAAISFLTDSLEGISVDDAIGVIRGYKKLVGDVKGIDIEDDDQAEAMQEVAEFLYGRVFKVGDCYWKVYACVVGPWDKDDYTFALKGEGSSKIYGVDSPGSSKQKDVSPLRSLYYANDPYDDMLVVVDNIEFLCKRADTPPIWFKVVVNNPVDAISKMMAVGNLKQLEQRGSTALDMKPIKDGNTNVFHTAKSRAKDDLIPEYDKRIEACYNELQTLPNDRLNVFISAFEELVSENDFVCSRPTWDIIDTIRATVDKRRLASYAERIREQALTMGGFTQLNLTTPDGEVYSAKPTVFVPTAPLIRWALGSFDYKQFDKVKPEWVNICPPGLKMMNDNPNHSDFFIGCGEEVSIDHETMSTVADTLEGAIMRAAYDKMYEIVKEWTTFSFASLVKGSGTICAQVQHAQRGERTSPINIVICEDASVDYQHALMNSRALICETGGKLAHLAIVGRELGVPVLLLPNARKLYKQGAVITIDFEQGTITQVTI